MYSFGFIGCGNMGGALASAVNKTSKNIVLADASKEKAKELNTIVKGEIKTNKEVAASSRYIVLGVKPQILSKVLEEIAPVIKTRKDSFVIVSMAAGVTIKKIEDSLGEKTPIIRIMPNTPASIGKGVILYSYNKNCSKTDVNGFIKGFSKAGEIIEIQENLIDAASAISGCGPAFVYMFINSLADGGVECGLPRDLSLKLASLMVEGSALMVNKTDKHPERLKDEVCSPGGSTIVGVEELENGAFRGTIAKAVVSSCKKTKELG